MFLKCSASASKDPWTIPVFVPITFPIIIDIWLPPEQYSANYPLAPLKTFVNLLLP